MMGYFFSGRKYEKKGSQEHSSKNIETKITSLGSQILDREMLLETVHTNSIIPRAYSEIKRMFNTYIRK